MDCEGEHDESKERASDLLIEGRVLGGRECGIDVAVSWAR
jgi:hypothetical protein